MSLANLIYEIRSKEGINQKEFCDRFNKWGKDPSYKLNQSLLSNIEKSKDVRPDLLEAILQFIEETCSEGKEVSAFREIESKGKYGTLLEVLNKLEKTNDFYMLEILRMLPHLPGYHLKSVYEIVKYSAAPYSDFKIEDQNLEQIVKTIKKSARHVDKFIYPLTAANHHRMEQIIAKFIQSDPQDIKKIVGVLVELIEDPNIRDEVKSNLFWQLCFVAPQEAYNLAKKFIQKHNNLNCEMKRAVYISLSLNDKEEYYEKIKKDKKLREHCIDMEERIWGEDDAIKNVCEMVIEKTYPFVTFFQLTYLGEKLMRIKAERNISLITSTLDKVISDITQDYLVREFAKEIKNNYLADKC